MQINRIGSGYDTDVHQVTECMHHHGESKKSGAAAAASSDSSSMNEEKYSATQQQDGQLSLGFWLNRTLSEGRKLLGRIWGENTESDSGVNSAQAAEQVAAQIGAANPYFSAIENSGRTKQNFWEKVRIRFHSVAGQLTRRFSDRNTFQTKQEKPKEDLRKHSRYREDDLEIDCILTDDSYLMDSYDRKGEYSTLSTKNSK